MLKKLNYHTEITLTANRLYYLTTMSGKTQVRTTLAHTNDFTM